MIKQAIIIPSTLKVSPGKLAAQVAHAALGAFTHTPPLMREVWMREGMTKICLRVETEEELLRIMERASQVHLPFYLVRDAGRTEIPPGTITALAVGPGEVDSLTGYLKLY